MIYALTKLSSDRLTSILTSEREMKWFDKNDFFPNAL